MLNNNIKVPMPTEKIVKNSLTILTDKELKILLDIVSLL
jgi:hypothetical protein